MDDEGRLRTALRRAALAVSVLHDVDLHPDDNGVAVAGRPPVLASWVECAQAVGDADPDSDVARDRLARWLLARRWVADRRTGDLLTRARPVGLPVGHALHPGDAWVRRRVLGGALDLGLGFVDLAPDRSDEVVVVPDPILRAAGADVRGMWALAEEYLEQMGGMAAVRWRRQPRQPLRPMADCDVVTLLGSAVLRRALVGSETGGMRGVAAPTRNRGWLDLARIDPAFVLAAASLADPAERGFPRPVLVTAEEVVLAKEGGRPAEIVLRDPAGDRSWQRDVLYH